MINIVATECKPADERKFNDWYDNVHIPLLMKHPAIRSVARYKVRGGSEGQAKYLAIYEFASPESFEAFGESPEFAAARDEMRQTWGEGGFEIKWRAQFDVLGSWKR
ncbi:MAG: hypothetical protein A2147_09070 [Chloroflexi bacterium RBG_16_57_8]|nr:MAG: hypothetical protein A2147_09070 [Chloroflexi bacterium RBG_16_57_8]